MSVNRCSAVGCVNGPDDDDDGLCDACQERPAVVVVDEGGSSFHLCEVCEVWEDE